MYHVIRTSGACQHHTVRTPHTTITIERRTCRIGQIGTCAPSEVGRPITWGPPSYHDARCWAVFGSSDTYTCRTPREARAAIAAIAARAAATAGHRACADQWAAWCTRLEAEAVAHRREHWGVPELLRWGRPAMQSLGARTYSRATDQLARREVVRAALARLAERQARREARRVAEEARAGSPRRILDLAPEYRRRREERRHARALARLRAGRLGRDAFEQLLPELLERVGEDADAAVRQTVLLVGPAGDQAQADLEAMRTDEDFSGRRGRHHRLKRTTLHRVEHRPDWSAALLTLRDYRSFGSSRWGGDEHRYGSRGGSSYRCYLVVRDSTTGEAHILRVPPRHGNADTDYYRRLGTPAARIDAAVAWTFARAPAEYAPQVQA